MKLSQRGSVGNITLAMRERHKEGQLVTSLWQCGKAPKGGFHLWHLQGFLFFHYVPSPFFMMQQSYNINLMLPPLHVLVSTTSCPWHGNHKRKPFLISYVQRRVRSLMVTYMAEVTTKECFTVTERERRWEEVGRICDTLPTTSSSITWQPICSWLWFLCHACFWQLWW